MKLWNARLKVETRLLEEYKKYYETGYKTDVEMMSINGEEGTMEFTKNGVTSKAKYGV